MRVLQLNQNKAFTAALELNRTLVGSQEYLCLVTEPYKNKCRIASRPDGSSVLVTKSTTPPRVAIFYKGNFEILMIDSLSNEDCVVGVLRDGGSSFILASVYLDINKEVTPAWLTAVCEFAEEKGWPLLLGMDSNAHSTLYGPDMNACLLYTSDAADD